MPPAADWPGRHVLAVVDALAWPALVSFALNAVTVPHGLIGDVVIASCSMLAVRRAWTAAFRASQYRFTTGHVGIPLAAMLALGVSLKLAA